MILGAEIRLGLTGFAFSVTLCLCGELQDPPDNALGQERDIEVD